MISTLKEWNSPAIAGAYLPMTERIGRIIPKGSQILVMPSESDVLLQQIRRWLLVIALLLGVGTVTLANTGYVLTVTRLLYWQRLVFSAAGVIGGVVALTAGVQLLRSFSTGHNSPE
jgi:Na+-transporting NADH:ubiquinone oxidoreductase subunit NqrB